jgi:hypothetical protein
MLNLTRHLFHVYYDNKNKVKKIVKKISYVHLDVKLVEL